MSDDEVGSVAEEAAKLLAALQGWAREAGPRSTEEAASSVTERVHEIGEHIGHGPDCVYCPVCRAINFVRETSPEAKEKVVEAATELTGALVEMLSGLFATQTPPSERPSDVERIDLSDDEWEDDE